MGVVKSKVNEDETITFNILQFVPVWCTMSCHSVISERHCLFARVCHACGFVSSNNQYHLLPHQKNPPTSIVLPHDFAYVTAVITITNKPHITNNRSILIQLFQ